MIFVMYGFWPDINTGGLDIMRDMTLIACLSSLLNNSNGMLRRAFNIIGSVTLEMYIIHWPLYNVVWSITSTAGPYMPVLTTILMIVFTLTLAIPLNYMNSYLLKSHAKIVKRIWKRYDICIICLITVFLVLRQFMIINIL